MNLRHCLLAHPPNPPYTRQRVRPENYPMFGIDIHAKIQG